MAAWGRGGVEARKKTRRGQAANAVEKNHKAVKEDLQVLLRSKLPLALKQVGPLSKPPSQLRLRPVEVLAPRVFARRLCR